MSTLQEDEQVSEVSDDRSEIETNERLLALLSDFDLHEVKLYTNRDPEETEKHPEEAGKVPEETEEAPEEEEQVPRETEDAPGETEEAFEVESIDILLPPNADSAPVDGIEEKSTQFDKRNGVAFMAPSLSTSTPKKSSSCILHIKPHSAQPSSATHTAPNSPSSHTSTSSQLKRLPRSQSSIHAVHGGLMLTPLMLLQQCHAHVSSLPHLNSHTQYPQSAPLLTPTPQPPPSNTSVTPAGTRTAQFATRSSPDHRSSQLISESIRERRPLASTSAPIASQPTAHAQLTNHFILPRSPSCANSGMINSLQHPISLASTNTILLKLHLLYLLPLIINLVGLLLLPTQQPPPPPTTHPPLTTPTVNSKLPLY
nr:hypothetical transcript [Hymenolepis microstoma]